MFAILVGTNTVSTQYQTVFKRLLEIAIACGFEPPDTTIRVQRDQMPLDGWIIEQKGPRDGRADFLLAVTAPKEPGISPIPVMKTIDGSLFAVICMDSFFGVSREDQRDFSEFKDSISVEKSFEGFLESLKSKP
jgi:hypothetical protein